MALPSTQQKIVHRESVWHRHHATKHTVLYATLPLLTYNDWHEYFNESPSYTIMLQMPLSRLEHFWLIYRQKIFKKMCLWQKALGVNRLRTESTSHNFLCMLIEVAFDAITIQFNFIIDKLHSVVFIQFHYTSSILCVFKNKLPDCFWNVQFLTLVVFFFIPHILFHLVVY